MIQKNTKKEIIILLGKDQKLRLDLRYGKISDEKFRELNRGIFKKFKDVILKNGWIMLQKLKGQQLIAAFTLAQHAESLDFQKKFLKALKKLQQTKLTKKLIAYLEDRILIRQRKPQIYGTQLIKNKMGNLKLAKIRSTENLNRLRKKMGLESIEKYLKRFKVS